MNTVMDVTEVKAGMLEAVFSTLQKANEYTTKHSTSPYEKYTIYQCLLDAVEAI